jgi:CBS domain-containing protein
MKAEPKADSTRTGLSQAHDVMTTNVVTVSSDESVCNIAVLLLENGISAVPVVNNDGIPIGMVSEGDLVGRMEKERLARTDWWLALLTGKQQLDGEFQDRVLAKHRTARDVMSAPLVTVTEDTSVGEIARLLAIHHIKRVPVIRDERVVGIVSRANLLRVVAAERPISDTSGEHAHSGFLSRLIGEFRTPPWETIAAIKASTPGPKPDGTELTAAGFRHLVEDFHHEVAEHKDQERREAARRRREQTRQLIDSHVFDGCWRRLMHSARAAAEAGQQEVMLLRFPNQLCIDGGRAINTADASWPATLRGRSAEIYLRWEQELKPQGFLLSARILEFPDGKPGDVGLFLVWSDQS